MLKKINLSIMAYAITAAMAVGPAFAQYDGQQYQQPVQQSQWQTPGYSQTPGYNPPQQQQPLYPPLSNQQPQFSQQYGSFPQQSVQQGGQRYYGNVQEGNQLTQSDWQLPGGAQINQGNTMGGAANLNQVVSDDGKHHKKQKEYKAPKPPKEGGGLKHAIGAGIGTVTRMVGQTAQVAAPVAGQLGSAYMISRAIQKSPGYYYPPVYPSYYYPSPYSTIRMGW